MFAGWMNNCVTDQLHDLGQGSYTSLDPNSLTWKMGN